MNAQRAGCQREHRATRGASTRKRNGRSRNAGRARGECRRQRAEQHRPPRTATWKVQGSDQETAAFDPGDTHEIPPSACTTLHHLATSSCRSSCPTTTTSGPSDSDWMSPSRSITSLSLASPFAPGPTPLLSRVGLAPRWTSASTSLSAESGDGPEDEREVCRAMRCASAMRRSARPDGVEGWQTATNGVSWNRVSVERRNALAESNHCDTVQWSSALPRSGWLSRERSVMGEGNAEVSTRPSVQINVQQSSASR